MKLARSLVLAPLLLLALVPAAEAVPARGLAYSAELIVDESIPGFRAPAEITAPAGTVEFTVFNPKSSTGSHGVGIDGGQYSDIEGAEVLPGRSTSLTLFVSAGHTYTVYDSHPGNRAAGYAVKVKVVRKVRDTRRGKLCKSRSPYYFSGDVRVLKRSCRGAARIATRAQEVWEDSGSPSVVSVKKYTCSIDPFSPTGLRIVCSLGEKRITYSP